MVVILASRPSCLGFDFRGKIVNIAKVNQWHCLEESEQWLANVDPTHLGLASRKIVILKSLPRSSI